MRIVRTLIAPVAPGLVTRTVILAPGRSVVRKGVRDTAPARVLVKVRVRGQPLPLQVATSDAPAGTPVTVSRVNRVDFAVARAKKESVTVSLAASGVVVVVPPPEVPPPAGEL